MGKSTIGVVLAKVLGYQFLDLGSSDPEAGRKKKAPPDHFTTEGNEGFKIIENRVNASIQQKR